IVYEGDEAKGLHTRVFLTKEGLPTYEAKEIGNTEWKFATYPDTTRSVVVTANEQNDYFRVIYAAIEDLHPEWKGKLVQVGHGMMRFAEGKMSSRKGNVISGAELVESLAERIAERFPNTEGLPDELATSVAVAAVKFQVLKQATGKDIIFDPEQSISFEGDSGPYLQYTHARIASIERKAADAGVVPNPSVHAGRAGELERLISRFPRIVRRAALERAPHHVTNYLLELARAFNSYYASTVILDDSPETPYKLALARAVRTVLKEGLWILGIAAPEKM
ncbi:MAG TPA: arginine--tRNA ligase, partial [Candidatus Paceibacterota bacterium]|nr:arginine--tRNA ligase [Candidatus Paceibacterota bacterium]